MTGAAVIRPRRAARVIVLDPLGAALMFRFEETRFGPRQAFWATPGGQVETGEAWADAAARELREETGLAAPLGPMVHETCAPFAHPGRYTHAHERFFLLRVPARPAIDAAGRDAEEARVIQAHRWRDAADLRNEAEPVYPADLADVLARLAAA